MAQSKWVAMVLALAACGGGDLQQDPNSASLAGAAGAAAFHEAAAGDESVNGGAAAMIPAGHAGARARGAAGVGGSVAEDAAGSAGVSEAGDSSMGGSIETAGGAQGGAGAGGAKPTSGGAEQGGASNVAGASQVGGATATGGSGSAGAGGGQPDVPACVCSTGQCCDGCQFRPSYYLLGQWIKSSYCSEYDGGTQANPFHAYSLVADYWNVFCTGNSATEFRWGAHIKVVDSPCPSNAPKCVDPMTAANSAACAPK